MNRKEKKNGEDRGRKQQFIHGTTVSDLWLETILFSVSATNILRMPGIFKFQQGMHRSISACELEVHGILAVQEFPAPDETVRFEYFYHRMICREDIWMLLIQYIRRR